MLCSIAAMGCSSRSNCDSEVFAPLGSSSKRRQIVLAGVGECAKSFLHLSSGAIVSRAWRVQVERRSPTLREQRECLLRRSRTL